MPRIGCGCSTHIFSSSVEHKLFLLCAHEFLIACVVSFAFSCWLSLSLSVVSCLLTEAQYEKLLWFSRQNTKNIIKRIRRKKTVKWAIVAKHCWRWWWWWWWLWCSHGAIRRCRACFWGDSTRQFYHNKFSLIWFYIDLVWQYSVRITDPT